ncbi:MAG: hypothetical protein PHG20_12295, partial [Geobacteraceae bacterium]|nr:hypothetical protein [Geobacteraceae bacterium]
MNRKTAAVAEKNQVLPPPLKPGIKDFVQWDAKMKTLLVHPHGSNWMGAGKDITTIFNLMPPLGLLSIAAFLRAR